MVRSQTGVIAAVAAILVALYAAQVVEAARSALREDDAIQASRGAMRRLERTARDLLLTVKDEAATSHREHAENAESARRTMVALLANLRQRVPAVAAEVDRAQQDLGELGAAATVVFESAPPARAHALETFLERSARFDLLLEAIAERGSQRDLESHRRTLALLLAEGLAALVAIAAATVVLRGRREKQDAAQERARSEALDALASYLTAALAGEPAFRPAEKLRYLGHAAPEVDRVVEALTGSRSAHDRDRRRFTFSHELVEALELADTERQVFDALSRAAGLAFPATAFQSFLADDAGILLVPQVAGGAQVCAPATPEGCPAIRKVRALRHLPEGDVARCPCLTERERPVTCAFVSVRGRAAGVAQLVGDTVDGDLETLLSMCFAAGARLGVLRTLGEREAQAAIDPLTGLANRRGLSARLAQLERSGEPYAVLCADLDHFKHLNDTRGHDAGDRCLRLFARVLRDTCRTGDFPARQGGEEFAVILPRTEVAGAVVFAQRVRDALANAVGETGVVFTSSFGIAARPGDGATSDAVLSAADAALYSAKARGRDRAEVFGDPPAAATAAAPADGSRDVA